MLKKRGIKMVSHKPVFKIFVVDDDSFYNTILSNYIMGISKNPSYSEYNIQIFSYYSAEECIGNINKKPDVILLDYFLEEEGHPLKGIYLLNSIRDQSRNTKVILMSQQQAMLASVEFLHQGAYDYVVKDTSSLLKIGNIVETILKKELADH
jgi:two-component system, OmpR family, response regulator